MAVIERNAEYGSFATILGENSMVMWTQALLEERRCMDCKAEIEDFDGAMEFRGQLPHIELVGHLCDACWERREEVRHYRTAKP